MYHFAPPRISTDGLFTSDTVFADAFQKAVPGSFAVVNAADIVPILPPSSLALGPFTLEFVSAVAPGNTVTYCGQLGDILLNHSLVDNYLPYTTALEQGFPS